MKNKGRKNIKNNYSRWDIKNNDRENIKNNYNRRDLRNIINIINISSRSFIPISNDLNSIKDIVIIKNNTKKERRIREINFHPESLKIQMRMVQSRGRWTQPTTLWPRKQSSPLRQVAIKAMVARSIPADTPPPPWPPPGLRPFSPQHLPRPPLRWWTPPPDSDDRTLIVPAPFSSLSTRCCYPGLVPPRSLP